MEISSLSFHFRNAPVFTARRYGSSQWIEVAETGTSADGFAIFVDDERSFDDLELIAAALTAAWSSIDPRVTVRFDPRVTVRLPVQAA